MVWYTRLFYCKKHAFTKLKAQNAKKIEKHLRNIARMRFRNLQKRILKIFKTQQMKQMLTSLCIKFILHILYVQMAPSTLSVTVETP